MANTIGEPIEIECGPCGYVPYHALHGMSSHSRSICALKRLRRYMATTEDAELLGSLAMKTVLETIDACIKAVETAENANQR